MKRTYGSYIAISMAVLFLLTIYAARHRVQAVTLTVNSTLDTPDAAPGNGVCADASGNCTLRAAIQEANALAGLDTIEFNIGTGTPTITPTSALPTITSPVIINGNTGGATRVELNGSSAPFANGLVISAGSSTVRNMVINRFGGHGILLSTSGGNLIEGNFIGTDASGTADLGNSFDGVRIDAAANNVVGGTAAGARNVISGNNERGVMITGSGATGNRVEGNFIGTDASGTVDLGNTLDGVGINSAPKSVVGGMAAGARNVISGNNQNGVSIFNIGATENTVEGNYIGTDVNGTADLGNSFDGVFVSAANNVVGGTAAGARNVISGNNQNGVNISGSGATGNRVEGNFIGTNASGTDDLGNTSNGVVVDRAPSNTIGGEAAGARNVISGNDTNGVIITGSGATANKIEGNYIGTDATGTADLGNSNVGVFIQNTSSNIIGEGGDGVRNIISGNDSFGVLLADNVSNSIATANRIEENFIGTDVTGTADLGNTLGGVRIQNSKLSRVGSQTDAGAGNVISGNNLHGIVLDNSAGSNVFGNFIGTQTNGTSPLGNSGHGVLVQSDGFNFIGGCCGGSNTIAFNDGDGVFVQAGVGVRVEYNSIHSNAGLGIDLAPDGPNIAQNDACDPDTGPNNLQNFPVITSATSNGTTTTVMGTLNSLPARRFDILFYSNTTPDPSSFGEGETLLGSTAVTTSGAGDVPPCTATFIVSLPAVPLGSFITATSTYVEAGLGSSTSEFSQARILLAPTAVDITDLTAKTYDGGVLVEWQTGVEVDNLGFRVYRETGGSRQLLNRQMIAGSALVVGPNTRLETGRAYSWRDSPPAGEGVSYWLEDVDLNGQSTWHGPVFVKQAHKPLPARIHAVELAGLGKTETDSSIVEAKAQMPAVSSSQRLTRFNLAAGQAVKLTVEREGWYRVTQQELVAAGLDAKVDPRQLQLFVDGQPLPLLVAGEEDGRFDPSDAIEFYGMVLDSPTSDERVYWLAASKTGLRIKSIDSPAAVSTGGSFPYTIERRDRTIYFSALRNGEAENFFGAVVASQPIEQTLNVQRLDLKSSQATLEVALQGVSHVPHQVAVTLNGNYVGQVSFGGQSRGAANFTVPASQIREGQNQVTLVSQAGQSDVSLVDHIRLTYDHTYSAENHTLKFSAAAGQRVTIDGFSGANIRLFDVTSPGAVTEVTGHIEQQGKGYTLSVVIPGGGERTLLALIGDRAMQPAKVAGNIPSTWQRPDTGADLVIITRREMLSAVEVLRVTRQSQGLSVAVVDVEDVYDEFSHGHKTPHALKEFLAYAKTAWKRAPRYALFIGDASYDPKNYLGFGETDFVPTKLVDTLFMETASDDWLADFNADGLADLAIGRLPVRTGEEAERLIAKVIQYEKSTPPDETLLVADVSDGFDFESANAQLRNLLPRDVRAVEINRGQMGDAAARAALLEAISRGQRIVNYTGHGNVDQWKANLLTAGDIGTLGDRHLSLYVMMTCLNGYFHDPAVESLAEALMTIEQRGAAAVWTSTGMTLPAEQALMNQELYRQLFAIRGARIGDATRAAKVAIHDTDVRRTWVLLGDPTMRVK